jgi:hypothetical protein
MTRKSDGPAKLPSAGSDSDGGAGPVGRATAYRAWAEALHWASGEESGEPLDPIAIEEGKAAFERWWSQAKTGN